MVRTRKYVRPAQREQAVALHKEGCSLNEIGRRLEISSEAVKNAIKIYNQTGGYEGKKHPGRKPVTDAVTDQWIIREASCNRSLGPEAIAAILRDNLDINIKTSIVRHRLEKAGLLVTKKERKQMEKEREEAEETRYYAWKTRKVAEKTKRATREEVMDDEETSRVEVELIGTEPEETMREVEDTKAEVGTSRREAEKPVKTTRNLRRPTRASLRFGIGFQGRV